jgi:hypothetical protein
VAESTLEGCFAKLDRAKAHIEDLKVRLDSWITETNPYSVEANFNYRRLVDHDPMEVIGRIHRKPPPDIPARIGDIIHNLRSSLDHLAWGLSAKSGSRPPTDPSGPWRRVQSPFSEIVNCSTDIRFRCSP